MKYYYVKNHGQAIRNSTMHNEDYRNYTQLFAPHEARAEMERLKRATKDFEKFGFPSLGEADFTLHEIIIPKWVLQKDNIKNIETITDKGFETYDDIVEGGTIAITYYYCGVAKCDGRLNLSNLYA